MLSFLSKAGVFFTVACFCCGSFLADSTRAEDDMGLFLSVIANIAANSNTVKRKVSGYVRLDNVGMDDVAIFDGSKFLTETNSQGYYETLLLYGIAYTLEPQKDGYTFTPSVINIPANHEDYTNQNFTASAPEHPVIVDDIERMFKEDSLYFDGIQDTYDKCDPTSSQPDYKFPLSDGDLYCEYQSNLIDRWQIDTDWGARYSAEFDDSGNLDELTETINTLQFKAGIASGHYWYFNRYLVSYLRRVDPQDPGSDYLYTDYENKIQNYRSRYDSSYRMLQFCKYTASGSGYEYCVDF